MPLAHRITTLERLVDFLPSAKARLEGEDRKRVVMLIDAASIAIEEHIQRPVVVRTFTERHSGGINGHLGGARKLFLEKAPIVSVASIEDDDTPANTVDSDDYWINSDLGYLEYRGGGLEGAIRSHGPGWPAPVGAWTVTYDAGLAADTETVEAAVPDIELACLMLTRDLWRGGPPNLQSKSSGKKSESYSAPRSAFSGEVKSLLEPHVLRGYA